MILILSPHSDFQLRRSIIYTYFTHTAASNTPSDYVTHCVMYRIFNTSQSFFDA